MYESFYNLKEKPFSLLPDPHFLYMGSDQSLALAMLEYGLQKNTGFVVLTGPIGSGKTTLVRQLLGALDHSIQVGYVANTHSSFDILLKQIFSAFEIDDRELDDQTALHKLFVDFLLDNYAKQKETVLIVDEAQNVSAEELEQLRLISNINSEKDQLLNIILAGQPELRDTIAQKSMKQFAQRISVYHELKPLSSEEVEQYILKRLTIAGSDRNLFTSEAAEVITLASGGIPRLINRLCESALGYGYAGEEVQISSSVMRQVVADQRKVGLLSDAPPDTLEIRPEDATNRWFKEEMSDSDRRLLASWVFSSN